MKLTSVRLVVYPAAELCKNIPAKLQQSLLKCSAAHPKITACRNITAIYSRNLAGRFLHYLATLRKNLIRQF